MAAFLGRFLGMSSTPPTTMVGVLYKWFNDLGIISNKNGYVMLIYDDDDDDELMILRLL